MSGRDVLCCFKNKVSLNEIQGWAKSLDYRADESLTLDPELVIEFPEGGVSWWIPEKIDNMQTYLEDWQIERIRALKCDNIIQVTAPKDSFPELIRLLKLILENREGYVTCDEKIEVLYTIKDIALLDCR